jgi:hypothetical protein
MKYSILLLLPFGFVLSNCRKNSSNDSNLPELKGILTSDSHYEIGEPTMYIYNQDPTTDQVLIDGYLQRHRINDFVFRITETSVDTPVTINAEASMLRFQIGNDSSFNATQEIVSPYHLDLTYIDKGDTLTELKVSDAIPVNGSFYASHCEMTNYDVSMIGPYTSGNINHPTVYRSAFPLQYKNGRWVIHIITSFLTENDSSNNCSSLLKNRWGINRIKYLYPEHENPLSPGDTVVMQSKDLYFTQTQ